MSQISSINLNSMNWVNPIWMVPTRLISPFRWAQSRASQAIKSLRPERVTLEIKKNAQDQIDCIQQYVLSPYLRRLNIHDWKTRRFFEDAIHRTRDKIHRSNKPAEIKALVAELFKLPYRTSINQILAEMPEDQWEEFENKLDAIIGRIPYFEDYSDMFSDLQIIPPHKRLDLVTTAASFIAPRGLISAEALPVVLRYLVDYPQIESLKDLNLAALYTLDQSDYLKDDLALRLFQFPVVFQPQVIAFAAKQCEIHDLSVRCVLEALEGLAPHEWFRAIDDVLAIGKILGRFQSLTKDVITPFKGLTSDEKRGLAIDAKNLLGDSIELITPDLLKVLRQIPVAERKDLIRSYSDFLKTFDIEERSNALSTLLTIPDADRESQVKMIAPRLTDFAAKKCYAFYAIYNFLKTQNGTELFTLAEPIIEGISCGGRLTGFLEGLQRMPFEHCKAVINTLLMRWINRDMNCDLYEALTITVSLPPEYQEEGLVFCNSYSDIGGFYSAKPIAREKAKEYFFQLLESVQTEPEKARSLSDWIADENNPLQLDQDEPLFQRAVELYTLTDPETANDPKNPFLVFKKLQELHKKQVSIPQIVQKLDNNQSYSFNQEFFQIQAQKAAIKVTVADLPKDIPTNTLNNLYENLITSLEGKFAAVQAQISAITDQQETLQTIKAMVKNLLDDPFFRGLLQYANETQQDKSVPLEAAQFFCIMQYILSRNNDVLEGELTQRETALLALAPTLVRCNTGKREAVELAYKLLPPEYQTLGKLAINLPPLEWEIHNIAQQELLKPFSENSSFIRGISKGERLAQPIHDILFTKNFLSPVIGLTHPLKFDRHTGYLNNNLAERLSEEGLVQTAKEFYASSIQPKEWVALVKNHLNDKIQQSYQPLVDIEQEIAKAEKTDRKALRQKKSELATAYSDLTGPIATRLHEEPSTSWNLDDDSRYTSLKESGAAHLLSQIGYLRQNIIQKPTIATHRKKPTPVPFKI